MNQVFEMVNEVIHVISCLNSVKNVNIKHNMLRHAVMQCESHWTQTIFVHCLHHHDNCENLSKVIQGANQNPSQSQQSCPFIPKCWFWMDKGNYERELE